MRRGVAVSHRLRIVVAALAAFSLTAVRARAGMPSINLPDVPRVVGLSSLVGMRLEAISFFLVCLLLCAWLIQLVWNGLRKDFGRLPRLSFGKAIGVVTLWGLLFGLVLTMISGARELMTPGAWEKHGYTYRLADDPGERAAEQIAERTRHLESLSRALVDYARAHEYKYPAHEAEAGFDPSLWMVPGMPGRRYRYRPGTFTSHNDGGKNPPLVWEPDDFGEDRLVMLDSAVVLWLPAREIERRLHEEPR